jgi:tetratricopeptide (TPR) repeat protein
VISFQHIEYLVALILVPVMISLYLVVIRWKKQTAKKIGDARLVEQLVSDYSPSRFFTKFILFILAYVVAVVALANPRTPRGSTNVTRTGIDVMIALDVSKSMLAEDIKPNRLERAKQIVSRLIDRLKEDRIGIVVFAGRAYLQMPLTTDHAAAKMYLSSATPDVVPTQGTVIGDALKMCYSAFSTTGKKYHAIVLISDGEDHDRTAASMTKTLASEGVMINTIGIGSPEGAMIIEPETNQVKRDAAGNPVVTKLNETELKNIAANANGIYQFFTNTDEVVTNLETQLKTMGQKPITENSLINFKNFFPVLLIIVLVILLAEFLLPERVSRSKQPKTAKKPAAAISLGIALLLPFWSLAQKENALIKKGNEAYNRKEYETALQDYMKAAEKNPASEKANYNLGNALFRTGKPEDAVAAYEAAIGNSRLPLEKAGTFYNKGVVLQNNKKLAECIAAYKNSLRLNPTDEDARLNLQKALQQQQQERQKEKDNKEQKKPKDDPRKKGQQKQQEDKNKDEQPKPQPSRMTRKEAEEKLNALLQQEKKLQDKLRKVNAASPEKPEKDW